MISFPLTCGNLSFLSAEKCQEIRGRRWQSKWGDGSQKEEMVDCKTLALGMGRWLSKRDGGKLKDIGTGNGEMAI